MLVDWTEGTGGSGSQTRGSAAKANESTWNMRLAPSTPWSAPGGAAPIDFEATPSASTPVTTRLAFASTSQLVADVQAWVDDPSTNFGWILNTESEHMSGTARRFGSRESGTAPSLVVTFTAAAPPTAPEITSQPQDQTVFAGETATFSVAASGTAPLNYQWSLSQATLPGATNATLVLANVAATNAGSYTVSISNAAGAKVSAPATLTLAPAPLIQPVTLPGGGLNLGFAAQVGHNYFLQYASDLSALPAVNWQTLTNIPAPPLTTNVLVLDPVSNPQRFYRLEAVQAP